MSTTTATDKKDMATVSLIEQLSVYHDIGFDTDGRSHFFEPAERVIIVCDTDRRGVGIRESDIVETVAVGSKTVDDYVRYVRDETGTEWLECDWAPEAI